MSTAKPSLEIVQAVEAGLEAFRVPGAEVNAGAVEKELTAIPVYVWSIANIESGVGPNEPSGWRFLSALTRLTPFACEVGKLPSTGDLMMTSVSVDPVVCVAIRKSSAAADNYPNYERVLRIPDVPVEAYWLKPESGDELVMPYPHYRRNRG